MSFSQHLNNNFDDSVQANVVNQNLVNYTKQQQDNPKLRKFSVVSIALLIAGFCFLAIMGIGFVVEYCFPLNDLMNNSSLNGFSALLVIALCCIVASSIMSFIFVWRIYKSSYFFIGLLYVLFIFGYGVGFGMIFTQLDGQDMMILFGSIGVILLSSGLFGSIISRHDSAYLKLSSFVWFGCILLLILCLMWWLLSFFNLFLTNQISMIVTILSTVFFYFFLIFDIASLIRSNTMLSIIDNNVRNKVILFYSFRILNDLVAIALDLIRIILATKR